MSVIRLNNFIDAYRLRAAGADLHAMAARRKEGTEFVSAYILDALQLTPEDALVDIGCGDGCLLRMAEGKVAGRIGIVPNEEEKSRLDPIVRGASILRGLCQKIPLPSETASKIVCNGVLIYLASAEEVRASLREMGRIARPGARVWVGEIPIVDEFEKFGMYRGNSVVALLHHTLTKDGPRAFLGMGKRLLFSWMGRDQVVLELEHYCRHRELDSQGNAVVSQLRYDYVFRK
jgi:SAM-dependent methyltransferase